MVGPQKMKFALLALLLLTVPAVCAGTQTVSTVVVDPSPIDLAPGTIQTVDCSATITDTDNWNNITTVNATFWDAVSSTETSADDNNNHYTNTECTLGANDTATSRIVNCKFYPQYYANASTWTCKIRSYNSTGDLVSNESNATVNQLIAVDVTEATIDFGTLALGATSSSDASATVKNTGNVQIDVRLSGDDMTCSPGAISVGSIKYSASSGNAYADMTALTGGFVTLDLNIPKSTGAASTALTYWKVKIPSSGVGSTCTDTVTFTAVSG